MSCVLIVDDEAGILECLVEVVEMTGCSALTASDGAEALAILATQRPCLVILDLLMPNVSGFQLLDEMKKDPALAGLPVLVSTSAPDMAPPGLPILRKPINIQAAWDHIRRACECGPDQDN